MLIKVPTWSQSPQQNSPTARIWGPSAKVGSQRRPLQSFCLLLAVLDNAVVIVWIFILIFSWEARNQQNSRISECVLVVWVHSTYSVEKECIHKQDDHISIKHWDFKCEWLYAINQGLISFFSRISSQEYWQGSNTSSHIMF